MGPRQRKTLLAIHITVSVGWIGAVLGYLVFDVRAATSHDAQVLQTAYASMWALTQWVIVPLALASLATGLLMGLLTPWGLFRHWWVLLSLVLTGLAVGVLLVEARTIDALAASARGASPQQLRDLPHTLPHSVGGLVVLLIVQVLNVVKPRGVTRYGWRRQARDRDGTPGKGP